MTKISILGCGWLGLPLAKALLEKGFSLHGSTTSSEKLSILENAGISPFLISFHSKSVSGSIESFLLGSDTLLIDIPPKLRGINSESFVEKIATLVPFIEKSAVKNVLFISSTSVYGEENDIVTEETPLNPDTESGKQLVEAEQILQSNTNFKTTVIRFGGLIGEDRHPVKFLAGRENLDNPEAPINLIHQEDCIGIILKIIETDCWNETFNAVAPFHPSRATYYTQKAADLNLPLPKFNDENASIGKTILSDKVATILKYTFTKPSL
ncbi:nucleoside-diphosphate-sugar epimerase [Flavobacterium sp. CG_23.5]|uniref:SDR family oxidoreductase n=1 Tax=Flavobacterium sp. CG_23.5 TaxID=2760708 RepID=UPI001AE2BBA1|nr:SDR family oxidoreductase [Flavobacterium sp. CG_23.5]MBP2283523.1 nucleoside-diphosphate-sugar epimerase [Flavobacterium sp. CG_23.5]